MEDYLLFLITQDFFRNELIGIIKKLYVVLSSTFTCKNGLPSCEWQNLLLLYFFVYLGDEDLFMLYYARLTLSLILFLKSELNIVICIKYLFKKKNYC